jgi:hypothetical protein
VRDRHGDRAAAGAHVEQAAARAGRRSSASSTISSVSGRGISTASLTSKSRPKNSRLPTM